MKAVAIYEHGDRSVLRLTDLPEPRAESHDVLIRVRATGINPLDTKVRDGSFGRLMGKFPKVLGAECAGVVEAVGELVTDFSPGDRVVASLGPVGGGYAERVSTHEKNVAHLPDAVDFRDGAALVVGGLTSLIALRDQGHLRPGEHVVINGASGGVGVAGVQIGKILHGHMTAVCSAANAELVQSLGADRVIDYKTTDFTKEPEQFRRYRIVFDAVGKRSLSECRDVLSKDGVYVSTLPSPKQIAETVLSTFAEQKAKVVAFAFRREDMAWLLQHAAEGRLKAVIDRTYTLDQIAEAHEYSESGRVKGKLVVDMGE
ncbi:NAD(P)-dependent alcohol dehydrogenase [Tellurirhabdus rosea]|uniref:NAD(P)-dependent alcohol dehydrogenase n=1 Tax=Tellurirhabdus rosea TaxID=2674997 RepID=UPI002257474A|nr:NAD(P)-dependent alcohol dehydrogenase [Tellurirhabdus rosea]